MWKATRETAKHNDMGSAEKAGREDCLLEYVALPEVACSGAWRCFASPKSHAKECCSLEEFLACWRWWV